MYGTKFGGTATRGCATRLVGLGLLGHEEGGVTFDLLNSPKPQRRGLPWESYIKRLVPETFRERVFQNLSKLDQRLTKGQKPVFSGRVHAESMSAVACFLSHKRLPGTRLLKYSQHMQNTPSACSFVLARMQQLLPHFRVSKKHYSNKTLSIPIS